MSNCSLVPILWFSVEISMVLSKNVLGKLDSENILRFLSKPKKILWFFRRIYSSVFWQSPEGNCYSDHSEPSKRWHKITLANLNRFPNGLLRSIGLVYAQPGSQTRIPRGTFFGAKFEKLENFELAEIFINHKCRKSGRISTRFGYVIVLVNTNPGKEELAPWLKRSSGGEASKLRFFRNFVICDFDGLVLCGYTIQRPESFFPTSGHLLALT